MDKTIIEFLRMNWTLNFINSCRKYFFGWVNFLTLISCITNYMPNNQFRRGELYSFITGMASTAIARRLQKNFKQEGIEITIEQWSVLYHLWKNDGIIQQE